MKTQGEWDKLHNGRCQCASAELEETPSLPNATRCVKCGGWFALRISSMADLERFRECFATPDLPPSK